MNKRLKIIVADITTLEVDAIVNVTERKIFRTFAREGNKQEDYDADFSYQQ